MLTFLFFVSVLTTAIMVGVIWIVQLVHYPFFHRIDRELFGEHMDAHRTKISYIVVPVMLVELAASIGLLVIRSPLRGEFAIALALLLGVWASTALLQVPSHSKLAAGYDKSEVDKLVSYNWIRTILWTIRLFLLVYILPYLP
jgi:hypothetical protein